LSRALIYELSPPALAFGFFNNLLGISLAIFMLLLWPILCILRGNTLSERISGIPCTGEGRAMMAIAMSFVTAVPMIIGLSKRLDEAKMAVFRLVGVMSLS
jgi:hypothetical protein